jgi:hypothetical protein
LRPVIVEQGFGIASFGQRYVNTNQIAGIKTKVFAVDIPYLALYNDSPDNQNNGGGKLSDGQYFSYRFMV